MFPLHHNGSIGVPPMLCPLLWSPQIRYSTHRCPYWSDIRLISSTCFGQYSLVANEGNDTGRLTDSSGLRIKQFRLRIKQDVPALCLGDCRMPSDTSFNPDCFLLYYLFFEYLSMAPGKSVWWPNTQVEGRVAE